MKTSPYAAFWSHPLRGFFGVMTWRQSYLNIVYLILGFPLGLAYFVFYVTGGALGIGLLIVTVGAAILLLLFYVDALVLLIGAEINSEIDNALK